MKVDQVSSTGEFVSMLPSRNLNTARGRYTSQHTGAYQDDEIYLKPIAVIENPFSKKMFESHVHEKGRIVDIYA